jgi:quercetin dioxygenase-like cupin family protein
VHITRLRDAKAYSAAKHFNMTGLRLQGLEASPTQNFWVGLSYFLPGGGAESSSAAVERVYVVTEGEITLITDAGEETLHPMDSCLIGPGERREIINRGNAPAALLVIMQCSDKTPVTK